MCEFCEKFDFSKAGININTLGAFISLPLYLSIPVDKQFNFCPKCGIELKNKKENKYE